MDLSATAVVFERPNEMKLRNIELPAPGDEDVVIDNVYTGVSVGTEGWILRGQRPEDTRFPCVPGYQQTGIISYVGSGVTGHQVGDRVNASGTRLAEGECVACWGGHVSRSVTDYRGVVKIPDRVSLKAASMSKLFSVGYHGVQQSGLGKGDLVAVIGMGFIGQGFAQVARAKGATVIGGDLVDSRLALAGKYSCDTAVNGAELERAIKLISPEGADVTADTTGNTRLIDSCVRMVKPGGTVVWQGWYPGEVCFAFHPAHNKRVKMAFPCGWEGEEVVLDMLADGRLTIEPLISHTIDASDAEDAYALMSSSPSDFMGITLKWRDE